MIKNFINNILKTRLSIICTVWLFICFFLIISCEQLDIKKLVRVDTGEITEIGPYYAIISGAVLDVGKEGYVEYGYCWSESPNPTINSSVTDFRTTYEKGEITAVLEGLVPTTTYYARAFAKNSSDTVYGDEISFTTIYSITTVQYAYWPFDTDASDKAGGKNGTPVGSVSYVNDAERGQVLMLDGESGYIELPSGLFENVTNLTITCWFNWAGGADWQRVYDLGYTDSDGINQPTVVTSLFLSPSDWDDAIHLALGNSIYNKFTDLNPQSINTSTWYFTAVIKKADSLIFYLDDQIIATDTTFLTPVDLRPDNMNWIGKSHWPDPLYNGKIDDLRLFKRALTRAEVIELYTYF